MIKLSVVLFAAAALVGVSAMPSVAAVAYPPTKPGCQINCEPGEPANPGEPFNPFGTPEPEGCMFNCGDTSTIPDPKEPELPDPEKPGVTTQLALDGCGEKLGGLRDVTVSQIRGVESDDVVDIIPVCRSKSLAAEQDSVAELRPEINENATLNGELRGDGYNANDVVGVIVNGKAVTLYVHRI
jgi:hypothetical protein